MTALTRRGEAGRAEITQSNRGWVGWFYGVMVQGRRRLAALLGSAPIDNFRCCGYFALAMDPRTNIESRRPTSLVRAVTTQSNFVTSAHVAPCDDVLLRIKSFH
jgi:hypothetical protein